ncbi:MAG: hypothetical protein KGI60_01055 [Patescibacteria group bacterium]|nr:hypothetical protein [Patescibacteria group bacterium]
MAKKTKEPKQVVVLQPRVVEFVQDNLQGYIDYNKQQILEFLQAKATADPCRLFKPNDLDVAQALKMVFDSCDGQIREIAHIMVGIKRREYCIASCDRRYEDPTDSRFVIAFTRLEVYRSIKEIVDLANAIRKEKSLKLSNVSTAMELMIIALESLPDQNFYMTFSGIKETKTPN